MKDLKREKYIDAKREVERQPYYDNGSKDGGNFGRPKWLYQEKQYQNPA